MDTRSLEQKDNLRIRIVATVHGVMPVMKMTCCDAFQQNMEIIVTMLQPRYNRRYNRRYNVSERSLILEPGWSQ
jgi:hypothetical protein